MEKKNILNSLPEEYRPLSPWSYFGYSVLFSIPIVGLVCLFIFAFNNNNINRRNFARSYFCIYVLVIIIAVILILLNVYTTEFYSNLFAIMQRA